MKTIKKMKFDLAEFIRQNNFTQTRESDKRDIFEKVYYHPFYDSTYNACITISYDSGYSKFNNNSIWLMTIHLVELNQIKEDGITLYNGIAPLNFDQAVDLLELILPSPDDLERISKQENF